MKVCRSLNELVNKMAILRPMIIAIDGEDGVGKTSLIAPEISSVIGATILSVDHYLDKDKGSYLSFIDYQKLEEDILNKRRPLIIEGVMLLSVMKRMELISDCYIYACSQLWYDKWVEGKNYSKFFNEIKAEVELSTNIVKQAVNPGPNWTLSGFREELYQYTYNQNPFKKAHTIFIPSDKDDLDGLAPTG